MIKLVTPKYVEKMTLEQKSFLLAFLKTTVSQNQDTPVAAPASVAETVLKSEYQGLTK